MFSFSSLYLQEYVLPTGEQ